jgi:hypothetical protein
LRAGAVVSADVHNETSHKYVPSGKIRVSGAAVDGGNDELCAGKLDVRLTTLSS